MHRSLLESFSPWKRIGFQLGFCERVMAFTGKPSDLSVIRIDYGKCNQ